MQNEKVPDNFEDPYEVASRAAAKMFKALYKKHSADVAQASAWFVNWNAYASSPQSPENPIVPPEELMLALAFKNEYYMLEILTELRKLSKNLEK